MNETGIAYIEFQNVSMTTALSYLYLIQLALSCTLETPVFLRWAIEKTGSNHTLYDITLRSTDITECINATWPNYQSPTTSPYSVGINYGISSMEPKILEQSLVSFNTWIAKANQTQSVATAMGSPYFFSAAPVQLLRLYTATYTPTSAANPITLTIITLILSVAIIVHNIV
jgi:hypothetical protein